MDIDIKRVYEKAGVTDGCRVLVDRLWPRGLSKDKARIDYWAKEIAPSTELRKKFAHDTDRWEDFKKNYHQELRNNVWDGTTFYKISATAPNLPCFTARMTRNTTMPPFCVNI